MCTRFRLKLLSVFFKSVKDESTTHVRTFSLCGSVNVTSGSRALRTRSFVNCRSHRSDSHNTKTFSFLGHFFFFLEFCNFFDTEFKWYFNFLPFLCAPFFTYYTFSFYKNPTFNNKFFLKIINLNIFLEIRVHK